MNTIDPTLVKLSPDASRYRKDMGDIQALAFSIKTRGQIQPIVVTDDMELIAGGRRLAACTMLQQPIKYVTMSGLSPMEKRAVEIEENIARKAFTPAEESLAIAELHEMRTKVAGNTGKKWTLQDTADELGYDSKSSVLRHLTAAEAVKRNPALKLAKTHKEITSAEKGQQKLIDRALALISRKENGAIMERAEQSVIEGDGLVYMESLPDGSIDLLLTDPPYGIDVDKQTVGLGTEGFKFPDSEEYATGLYQRLAALSFTKTSDIAHAVVFGSVEMFNLSKVAFEKAGWSVWARPFIWIKNTTGQGNNPEIWPTSCYEVAMFARKDKSVIQNYPMSDWVQFPPVLGEKRRHPTEKPLELMQHIVHHLGFPGGVLFDPFAGSFSSIHAGLLAGMRSTGVDIHSAAVMVGLERISKYYEETANGEV